MSREIVNSVLLLWGSLFCEVSSLYFWITKNYRTEKRGWIYRMQVSTSVLPLLAISIQIVHDGLALVDLAIGVAMVLMFLVSIKEQNEEMLRLETSRAHLAEKLDIATVLNRCVEKLSGGGHDLDKATHDLLGVINDYFCADRSYVYELDAAYGIAVNTHEFVRDGVSAEKDNLQKVPVEIIASWLEAFERDGIYFMAALGLGRPFWIQYHTIKQRPPGDLPAGVAVFRGTLFFLPYFAASTSTPT